MKSNHFLYQPDPMTSVIDWCWTFVILLTGIIFWLEVTHFQWITLLFFILFFAVAGLEIVCRRMIIKHHHLIVNNMFGHRWRIFDLLNQTVSIRGKHLIAVGKQGSVHRYLVSKRTMQQLKKDFNQ